jgi:16S rRNA (guanine(966)-N(2))-methyltransferase RsmD
MRVIAGTCKGRRLVAPKGSRTRPALDRIKESVFSILFKVDAQTVLDLFAGSGSVGIEALSRGAAHATFVENDSAALRAITSNIISCGFEDRSTIMKQDVTRALNKLDKKKASFDLIFVDPPYSKGLVNKTLVKLGSSNLAHEGSRIIVEHHPKEPINDIPGLVLTDSRKYGQTLISFLQKTDEMTND